jgi:hypothetical protein
VSPFRYGVEIDCPGEQEHEGDRDKLGTVVYFIKPSRQSFGV